MAKVIQLFEEPGSKMGYKKASKSKSKNGNEGQLTLFSQDALVIKLPFRYKTFDQALFLDEHRDPFAKEAYHKAIEEGDCVADSYCNLGILYSEQGEWEEAYDCFSKALINDPRHYEAHFNLGNLYFDKNDYRLARLHFEMANIIEPGFANSYFNLGLLYASVGDIENACTSFKKYIKLVPEEEASKAVEFMNNMKKTLPQQN
jgi:tetratricopeptide (TPR) repeat protein